MAAEQQIKTPPALGDANHKPSSRLTSEGPQLISQPQRINASGQFQSILLGDRGTCVNNIANSHEN